MITKETRIREEGVVTIFDESGNLIGIYYRDTSNKGNLKLYKTEEVLYGDIKDFLETIVDVKKTNG